MSEIENASLENRSSIEDVSLENCEEDYPIKTCDDNFIIIKENNNTGIIQSESCVFIQGQQENLTMITDEFLFKVFGITQ